MIRFYQVSGLKPGSEIVDEANTLKLDLTEAMQRPFLHSDRDVIQSHERGEYIWASGGGTFLFNNRYLPIVRRSTHARVNPCKYSLFTGRADNIRELLNPILLVRELFEELILFSGNCLYRPSCRYYDPLINHTYAQLQVNLGLNVAESKTLKLNQMFLSPKMTTIMNDGLHWEGLLDSHISSNREINILFVFSANTQIKNLRALDGEYHISDGNVVRQNRSIYLYDLQARMCQDISINRVKSESVPLYEDSMSEHLRYLIRSLNTSCYQLAPKK